MTSTSSTADRHRWWAIALAGATLLAPLIWLHDPDVDGHQTICPFRALTGLPCPGCGITRSLVFLYRGDLLTSLRYHLFGIPTALFCAAVVAVSMTELFTHKRYFRPLLHNTRLAWTLATVLMAYHSVRLVLFLHSHTLHDILHDSIWQ